MFVKPAQSVNSYLSEPNFLETNLKYSGQQREQVEQLVSYLVTNKPLTFEECIIWARLQFEEKYNNSIRQLLFSLPKDALTSTGQPFWSGPKRAPDPLIYDSNEVRRLLFFVESDFLIDHQYLQPAHLQYIIAAANLHAYNYGLRGDTDPVIFRKISESVLVPEFTPRSGVKVQVNENEPVAGESGAGMSVYEGPWNYIDKF